MNSLEAFRQQQAQHFTGAYRTTLAALRGDVRRPNVTPRDPERHAFAVVIIWPDSLMVEGRATDDRNIPEGAAALALPADWTDAQLADWLERHRAELETLAGGITRGVLPNGRTTTGLELPAAQALISLRADSPSYADRPDPELGRRRALA